MDELKKKIEETLKHVNQELATIRSGRAVPALVEDVPVEIYGSVMPVKQVASIGVPEPKTLAITPWDKQAVAAVTKALEKAELGAMPSVHGETIHVTLPALTVERREQLLKILGKMVEEGRIALRRERETAIERYKKDKNGGSISEDEFFRRKEEIEDQVKKANEMLDKAREKKEEELTGV